MELSFLTLLYRLFDRRDKIIISMLLLLSVLVSFIEAISISALMFFISLATDFSRIFNYSYFARFYHYLGFEKPSHFILFFGGCLLLFYAVRAAINAVHIYWMNNFAFMRQHFFAKQVFQKYLQLYYQDFVLQNSSTINHLLFHYLGKLTHVIAALLTISAEFLTVFCIYGMLFLINWKMTLGLTIVLGFKVLVIMKLFSAKITNAGKQSQHFSLEAGKIFTESFGNFKWIKLIGGQKLLSDRFARVHVEYARSNAINGVWQTLPRFVLETLGFLVLIGMVMFIVMRYDDAHLVLPMVSLYALAFYRFLPSLNKMMAGYNQFIFNKHSVQPVSLFLQSSGEQLGKKSLEFQKLITFQHVSFSYTASTVVLNQVNLKILKGERVGFMGPSGAGKSTTIDLLMGLLYPNEGKILIDEVPLTVDTYAAWRQKIGYIPQSIYLFDGTVAENIVCGRVYNAAKIVRVLQKAHIYDFLLSQKGTNTRIGEGGINLSGGQKQRIALARALYGDPELLVLDEATSALDHETEEKIMQEIYALDDQITLVIIAHRLTTIQRCDKIYCVDQGTLIEVKQHVARELYQKKEIA